MTDAKTTVLCVDDDPDVREILRVILESAGYICACAASAEEGEALFKTCSPAAVIVDLMMEEIDSGLQFVKELKMLGNEAPVIMLSSVGNTLSISADYDGLGLSGVLQKPIHKETLISLLESKIGS